MGRTVTLAATQFACSSDQEENVKTAERLVRAAAAAGANVICIQASARILAQAMQSSFKALLPVQLTTGAVSVTLLLPGAASGKGQNSPTMAFPTLHMKISRKPLRTATFSAA
jgi:hypothetical protein